MNTSLVEHVEHFQRRLIADALAEATSAYWLKRADDFEWARPSLADFPGDATLDQRRAKWRELTEVATACRAKARVSLQCEELSTEVDLVLEELVA